MTYNAAVLRRPPAADDTPRGVLAEGNTSDVVGHCHVGRRAAAAT